MGAYVPPFVGAIGGYVPFFVEGLSTSGGAQGGSLSVFIPSIDFCISGHLGMRAPFGREAQFFRDDVQPFAPFPRSVALCMFEWGLNWCVYSSVHKFLILHAAVVARDDRALLLSGRPGAGKSTLCAALVASGWRLLSDELALIDPESLNIYPLCRPVCLKEGSIDHMKEFVPNAVFGPVVEDTHKGAVCHMRPPVESLERISEVAYPAWIVLPKFDAEVETHTTPLSKASAFFELADNSFNYEILGGTAFKSLSSVIDQIDCYRLNHASTAEGIAEIERLTASSG